MVLNARTNLPWVLQANNGQVKSISLSPRSVADFYQDFLGMLRSAGIDVKIWRMPVEIPDPIPFDQDRVHASYHPEYARRFWQILVSVDRVFQEFRAGFVGKVSPVHFFWGSFDLAVTRFSGRRAPERENADPITRDAYSHEVISAGFWPGGGAVKGAAFYAYAAPEPAGFPDAPVDPTGLASRDFVQWPGIPARPSQNGESSIAGCWFSSPRQPCDPSQLCFRPSSASRRATAFPYS